MSPDFLITVRILKTLSFLFILVIFGTFGCSREEHFVDFSDNELIRLISGDTFKIWTRTRQAIDGKVQNTDLCSVKQKFLFNKTGNTGNNLDFEVHSNPDICNFPDSLIESGTCFITDYQTGRDVKDTLSFIVGVDTMNFGITSITSLYLSLRGKVKGALIENEFEWSQ